MLFFLGVVNGEAQFRYDSAYNSSIAKALAMIESGNNPNAKGKNGEVTQFQIKPSTYKEYTRGIKASIYSKEGQRIFLDRIINISHIKMFVTAKRNMTDRDFYIIYNLGYEGYHKHNFDSTKCPRIVQDRAERFSNLVHLYEARN